MAAGKVGVLLFLGSLGRIGFALAWDFGKGGVFLLNGFPGFDVVNTGITAGKVAFERIILDGSEGPETPRTPEIHDHSRKK